MTRSALALCALVLSACAPAAPPAAQDRVGTLASCDEVKFTGALTPADCKLQVGERVLALSYQAPPEGVAAGTVSADVLGSDGVVVQSIIEPDVAEYRAPLAQDIDGDGRADLIIVRSGGAVNADMALWVFNGERGVFQRVGDVNAVAVERTESGLIMAPARSSAVEWEVAFYHIDEGGLRPFATVRVTAPAGRSTEPGCEFIQRPRRGIDDDISTVSQRYGSICAAAASVFQ